MINTAAEPLAAGTAFDPIGTNAAAHPVVAVPVADPVVNAPVVDAVGARACQGHIGAGGALEDVVAVVTDGRRKLALAVGEDYGDTY